MGTHAGITVHTEDGLLATYVHYDGYPEHMVPELLLAIQNHGVEKVVEVVKSGALDGGMSGFDKDLDAITFYRDTSEKPCRELTPDYASYWYEITDDKLVYRDWEHKMIEYPYAEADNFIARFAG